MGRSQTTMEDAARRVLVCMQAQHWGGMVLQSSEVCARACITPRRWHDIRSVLTALGWAVHRKSLCQNESR